MYVWFKFNESLISGKPADPHFHLQCWQVCFGGNCAYSRHFEGSNRTLDKSIDDYGLCSIASICVKDVTPSQSHNLVKDILNICPEILLEIVEKARDRTCLRIITFLSFLHYQSPKMKAVRTLMDAVQRGSACRQFGVYLMVPNVPNVPLYKLNYSCLLAVPWSHVVKWPILALECSH